MSESRMKPKHFAWKCETIVKASINASVNETRQLKHFGKIPYGEGSVRRKLHTMRNLYCKNSVRQKNHTAKSPYGENSVWQKIHTAKNPTTNIPAAKKYTAKIPAVIRLGL